MVTIQDFNAFNGQRVTARTVHAYEREMILFAEFLGKTPLGQSGQPDLDRYLQQTPSPGSRRHIQTAFRTLFELKGIEPPCFGEKKTRRRPVESRGGYRDLRAVSVEELNSRVDNLPDNPICLRNSVLALIIAETGADLSTVLVLKIDDLLFRDGCYRIMPFDLEGMVTLGFRLTELLEKYKDARKTKTLRDGVARMQEDDVDSDWLFPSRKPGLHLSRAAAWASLASTLAINPETLKRTGRQAMADKLADQARDLSRRCGLRPDEILRHAASRCRASIAPVFVAGRTGEETTVIAT